MDVISSLVVVCAHSDNDAVKKELLDGDSRVEIIEQVPGKIGIVLVTDSTGDAEAFSSSLGRSKLVKDVILVYHNFEKEV